MCTLQISSFINPVKYVNRKVIKLYDIVWLFCTWTDGLKMCRVSIAYSVSLKVK